MRPIFNKNKPNKDHNDIKKDVSNIKEELEDHLDSINQNTNEIQSNYEYLCDIDAKLQKLHERLDEVSMFLGMKKQENTPEPIHNLTKNEQEVFLLLYTLDEEKGFFSYKDIARKLGLTELLVTNYITNLMEKGIPIIKKYLNNIAHVKLDPDFKNSQAKHNIVHIDKEVLKIFS